MKVSKPVITQDGSLTLFHEQTGEHYHSTFGAIQESEHIFINAGLQALTNPLQTINILEIGLGTGLNALLTMRWAGRQHRAVHYSGVEAFPPDLELLETLNYPEILEMEQSLLSRFYSSRATQRFSDYFQFQWIHQPFEDFFPEPHQYHLVYFDAFSPDSQPEMWTQQGFHKLFHALVPGGLLTTYSCKGTVKRALKAAGFVIEKLPGPPGKREFLRARVPGR